MLQLSFIEFKEGTFLLVDRATNNNSFYIIQNGKVQCENSFDPGKNATKILTSGDFVGVIPCMAGRSQIENAIALTNVKCISVKKEQYPELIEKNTPVALKIIKTFSNRMREMNEQLAELTLKNTSVDTPEHILDVAVFYDATKKTDIASYAFYRYIKECPQGKDIAYAQKRFIELKPTTRAVYFEPTDEMVRHYPKDTMIMAESQSGSEMFIIQEGEVTISKVVDGKEVVLALLKKGDMFGEMALLENKPRSASAIAHETCTLMVINRANFNQMVENQPQLVARLTTTFADRLWTMYKQLNNACLLEPLHKCIDMIAIQLEKARKTDGSYQTDYSINDIITMCGIQQNEMQKATEDLRKEKSIRINNDKIYVPDCSLVLKLASFYRKLRNENRSR